MVLTTGSETATSAASQPICCMSSASTASSTSQYGDAGKKPPTVNLASAKEARKRAELDAQLLANRIALLKQEEEKAWKKIEETRDRASEIMALRTENEKKIQTKEKYYKHKWEGIRLAQQQNAEVRVRNNACRAATRQQLAEGKRQGVSNMRKQSVDYSKLKERRKEVETDDNVKRTEQIKRYRERLQEIQEERRIAKEREFRKNYESRVAQEEMLRARTEALVAKMEKDEMDLIQRLQNTQLVQRSAYEELEGALGATSQSLSSARTPRDVRN
eukprot:GHVQ01014499.1.p1 GENE.GHVQ01014499.1~~GHVQ01014499.1.p1  ORF type:complete len:275 (-),score=44.16 GHVQ01014499.1:1571-2395(-)